MTDHTKALSLPPLPTPHTITSGTYVNFQFHTADQMTAYGHACAAAAIAGACAEPVALDREAVRDMAKEAGFDWHAHWGDADTNRLEVFAALVAAAAPPTPAPIPATGMGEQKPVALMCECGKCDWQDYYTGPVPTHRVCANCGFKFARIPADDKLRAALIDACNNERVDDSTGTDGDLAYNMAIDHCITAIAAALAGEAS